MRHGHERSIAALSLAALAVSAPALQAQQSWDAGLHLGSEYTDNAGKRGGTGQSERQDEARLTLGGQYENDLLKLDASYRARERRYSEDSQPDRSFFEGQGSFLLGKAHDPVDLRVSHSRSTVLNAPDALELDENTDERDILTVVPTARWQPSQADVVSLSGQYSAIRYRYDERRDSEREGGQLSWRRGLSPISNLSFNAQQTEVSFDAVPQANYRYSDYYLAYDTELRRLNYRVQLGWNETDPEVGEGLSGPSYQLSLGYGETINRWELSVRQYITDNSTGSGNQGPMSNFVPGDSAAGDLDQLERTRAELSWRYALLCRRCSMTVRVYHQQDDYRQELEDRDQSGASARLGYQLTERSSLDLTGRWRQQTFASEVARSDFNSERWNLSYAYQFPSGVGVRLFGAHVERSSRNDGPSYRENRGGAGIEYNF